MEILAPAGNIKNLITAINSGADAVYLGLTDFSARKSADNFTLDDLEFYVKYAKTLDVKVYLTVNTLIKDSEIERYVNVIRKAYQLGVDAFIVQDIFLGKYLKELFPKITLHLSTQGGVSNVYGAKMAKEFGFSRVILARETSFLDTQEIAKIIETEVFIQGALCTSFSGHCYFSSFIGGLSGNRGRCKQPCRKKCSYYDDISNKKLTDKYSLSLSDLSIGENVLKLKEIGVKSLKIEGRMRGEDYIFSSIKYYKSILNGDRDNKIYKDMLVKSYNRGDYTKGLAISQDKNFISSKIQGHKGYFIGLVKKIYSNKLEINSKTTFLEDDSFKIIRNGYEVGNAIVKNVDQRLSIYFKGDVKIGDEVYITKDNSIKLSYENLKKLKPIEVVVNAKIGKPLTLSCNGITVKSNLLLEEAKSSPITKDDINLSLLKTDIYPFKILVKFESFQENLFIIKSELNKTRAKLYSELFNGIISNNNDYIEEYKYNSNFSFNQNNVGDTVILSDVADLNFNIKNVIYSPKDYSYDVQHFINYYKDKKVFLYLPPFLSKSDIEILDKIVDKFYGVYGDGYYSYLYAKEKGLKLFAGTGFNVFNSISLSEILKYENIYSVAPSKELSFLEIDNFNYNFSVLNASKVQIMDLIYCPFGKTCNNCPYTDSIVIKDEENREFGVFRQKISSCQFKIYNLASVYSKKLDKFNTIYDLTNESFAFIKEFFSKNTNELKSKTFKRLTNGSYIKGIQW